MKRRLNQSHNDTGFNNQPPCDWGRNEKNFCRQGCNLFKENVSSVCVVRGVIARDMKKKIAGNVAFCIEFWGRGALVGETEVLTFAVCRFVLLCTLGSNSCKLLSIPQLTKRIERSRSSKWCGYVLLHDLAKDHWISCLVDGFNFKCFTVTFSIAPPY